MACRVLPSGTGGARAPDEEGELGPLSSSAAASAPFTLAGCRSAMLAR